MNEQNIQQGPFGDNQDKEPVLGEENERIIYIANAPEKFGELIRDEIISYFVEREKEPQKPVEINQLISKIRGNVFEEGKIKKIMMRNALSNSKVLEDYYYPLCLTNIFTLIKDKKLEIGGNIRKFLEAYISITKKNIPQKIEDGVVFLRIKQDIREQLIEKDNEEEKQEKIKEEPKEELEELTEEQLEQVIIDILKENQGTLTKRELFLELHILKKNKFSQILYGMKQKGLIDYPPGDWKKSQVTLRAEQVEEEEFHPKEKTEIDSDELKEEQIQEEEAELEQKELKELPEEENNINDPVQKEIINIFQSNWGEESLTLNRLFIILKTYDYDGRINLQRFSGSDDPEFIRLISSIPGIRINQDKQVIYTKKEDSKQEDK